MVKNQPEMSQERIYILLQKMQNDRTKIIEKLIENGLDPNDRLVQSIVNESLNHGSLYWRRPSEHA